MTMAEGGGGAAAVAHLSFDGLVTGIYEAICTSIRASETKTGTLGEFRTPSTVWTLTRPDQTAIFNLTNTTGDGVDMKPDFILVEYTEPHAHMDRVEIANISKRTDDQHNRRIKTSSVRSILALGIALADKLNVRCELEDYATVRNAQVYLTPLTLMAYGLTYYEWKSDGLLQPDPSWTKPAVAAVHIGAAAHEILTSEDPKEELFGYLSRNTPFQEAYQHINSECISSYYRKMNKHTYAPRLATLIQRVVKKGSYVRPSMRL